jgi:predicted phage-related endonuclease
MTMRVREIQPGQDGREQWLGWRKENINASEVGALFCVDKYRTPLALYYDKFTDLVIEPTSAATKVMRGGRWLESAVISAVAETRPEWEVYTPRHYIDDPDLRIGCTPDAYLVKGSRVGILQCKKVNKKIFNKWERDSCGVVVPPLTYQLQALTEAKVTNRTDFAVLAFLIVGYEVDLEIVDVPMHGDAWESICARTKRFFTDAALGIVPPVPPPDAELVKKIYPTTNWGQAIDLSRDNELPAVVERERELAAQISAIEKEAKPLSKEREGLRAVIKGKIGSAETAILPSGYMATFKTVQRTASAARTLLIKEAKD